MADKCTPRPASFDCFLITNSSRWESKICMYETECWSCLCCLPRSLLLKQICTFCSPGTDTSSGWTRTLSLPQPGVSARAAEKLEGKSLAVAVVAHSHWGGCSAMAGGRIEFLQVSSPACPGQLHMGTFAHGCRAQKVVASGH